MARIIAEVPEDLKQNFQNTASKNGQSESKIVRNFAEAYVKNPQIYFNLIQVTQ